MAQEIGKHLHEVLDWPGPMTRRQLVAWLCWLDPQGQGVPQAQADPELGKRLAEARKQAAMDDPRVTVVMVGRSESRTAADFLRAGASRKK